MLKLLVMRLGILILLVLRFVIGWFSPPAQLDLARIVSPSDGEALQGTVEIIGTVTGIGFQYAEINFQNDEGEENSTWFLIEQIDETIVDDVLAAWDTNAIADGDYNLQVVAYYEDGHRVNSVVEGLRVRNYTLIETKTAVELDTEADADITPTAAKATATPRGATPTPLPPNDLALDEGNFIRIGITGGMLGLLSLLIIGFWLLIRRRNRG